MKALIQRVSRAQVTVDNEIVGKIETGVLVLLGLTTSDTFEMVEKGAAKVAALRIFKDDDQKMNLSLKDISGSALVVSQFTLYGNTKKGLRPSFVEAAAPAQAEPLYQHFIDTLKAHGVSVATGRFGAEMDVELVNQGPVTLMVEL